MNMIFKRVSTLLILVLALSFAGCLSNNEKFASDTTQEKEKVEQPSNPTDGQNDNSNNTTQVNVSSNKKPYLTYFNTDDLDEAEVMQGDVVQFTARGLDPEGKDITIEYEATGGTVTKDGKWTAPNESGYFQVTAFAKDNEDLLSDPKSWTIRVNKQPQPGKIYLKRMPGFVNTSNKAPYGPQRALTVDDTSTTQSTYSLETGTSGTITLVFDDDQDSHAVSTNFTEGTLIQTAASQSGATYTYTYTYTAPSTAPSDGVATIGFTIFDPTDNTDTDSASINFMINTPPSINSTAVTVSGQTATTVELGGTATITVTATDADSDTMTYTYSILSGSGTLGSSTTNTIDFTAPSTAGTTVILIQVSDSKVGGTTETTVSIIAQSAMLVYVADSDAADYATVTGSSSADYDITTDTNAVNSNEYEIAFGPNQAMASSVAGTDTAKVFYSNNPVTAVTYQWRVYRGTTPGTIYLTGPNNASLDGTASSLDFDPSGGQVDGAGSSKLGNGGAKTLKGTATSGSQVVSDTDYLYVSEFPTISNITYTNASGQSATLFDGSSVTILQASPGQEYNFNISVTDPDNTRVSPDTTNFPVGTTLGYFINQEYTDEDTPGIEITVNLVDDSGDNAEWTKSTSNSTDIDDPTSTSTSGYYDHTDDYTTTVSNVPVKIAQATSADASNTYHYVAFHVNDGFEEAVDEGADGTIDYYRVGYEIEEYNADGNARGLDIGTVSGYTSYNKNLMLEFFAESGGSVYFKIKDIDAGTYWSKSGEDLRYYVDAPAEAGYAIITGDDGDLSNDGGTAYIDLTDADRASAVSTDWSDESMDWLAIDVNNVQMGNWEEGDKVYFTTYANSVIAKIQVVEGPAITSVSYPQYITLGNTQEINVYGDVGSSTSASVTVTESSSSGGTLTVGTDSDGDAITQEVWTYQAPSSMPANATVTLVVSITDGTYTNYRSITFDLNRNPSITGLTGSEELDTTDGYWILEETAPVTIGASVTDSDTTDEFDYRWTISSNQYGTLAFANTAAVDWTPYNGAIPLTDDGGPNSNGQYPITLTVLDKDTNGVLKGGIDQASINIGINEAPKGTGSANAWAHNGATPTGEIHQGATGTDVWSAAIAEDNDAAYTYDYNTDEYKNVYHTYFWSSSLTDSAADKSSLNFDWYITLDSENGPVATNPGELAVLTTTYADNNVPGQMLKWTPSINVRGTSRTYYIHGRVSDDKDGVAQGITHESFAYTVTADETAPAVGAGAGTVTEVLDRKVDNTYGIGDIIRVKIPLSDADNTGYRDIAGATLDIGNWYNGTGNNGTVAVINKEMTYSNNSASTDYSTHYLYYDFEVAKSEIPKTDYADGALNIDLQSAWDWNGNKAGTVANLLAAAQTIDNQPVLDGEDGTEFEGDSDSLAIILAEDPALGGFTKDNDMITLNDALCFSAGLFDDATNPDNDLASIVGSIYAPALGIVNSGYLPGHRANGNSLRWSFSFTRHDVGSGQDPTAAPGTLQEHSNVLAGEVRTTNQGYTGVATLDSIYKVDLYLEDNAGNITYVEKWILDDNSDIDGIDLTQPQVESVDIYSYDKDATTGAAGWAPVLGIEDPNDVDSDGVLISQADAGDDGYGRDRAAAGMTIDGTTQDLYKFGWLDVTSYDSTGTNTLLDDDDASTAEIIKLVFDEPLLVDGGASTTTIDMAIPNLIADDDANLVSSVNDTSIKVYTVDGAIRREVSDASNKATITDNDVVELSKIKNYAVRYLDTNGDQTWAAADAVKTEVYIVLLSETAADDDIDETPASIGHYSATTHFEIEFNEADLAGGAAGEDALGQVMDRNTNFINVNRENFVGDNNGISW